MKKIYRKPTLHAINAETTEVICGSGDIRARVNLWENVGNVSAELNQPLIDDNGDMNSETSGYRTNLWGD